MDLQVTISSVCLAEICSVRHDNILREIEKFLESSEGTDAVEKATGVIKNPQNNQDYPVFKLNKEQATAFVCQRFPLALAKVTSKFIASANFAKMIGPIGPDLVQEIFDANDLKALTKSFGFVYVCKSNGFVKIGKTRRRTDERVKQIQSGCALEIQIVYQFETPQPDRLEWHLHQVFKNKRRKGEWFDLSQEQIDSIPQIVSVFHQPQQTQLEMFAS